MKKLLGLAFGAVLLKYLAVTVFQPAVAQTLTNGSRTITGAVNYCADAGSTDAYACSLSPAITAYVTGAIYNFRANTANTGAASLNLNSVGAITIVKMQGGSSATLANNDIRAGQLVSVIYDGTNMQMQSTLGNGGGGGGSGTLTEIQFGDGIAVENGTGPVPIVSVAATVFESRTGTASHDFANLTAATCAEQVFSLAGAAVGDPVVATSGSLETGLIPFAKIATTGNVTLQLCNVTGSGINPALQTFRFTLTRPF